MEKIMKKFTPEEDKILKDNYINYTPGKLGIMLGRSKPSVQQRLKRLKLFAPKHIIKERREKSYFKKGNVVWNKGMKGLRIPGSEKTWFKKGHLPKNTKYDKCITIRTDHAERRGKIIKYKWIRLSQGKWQPYHQFIWEKKHGKIPQGHTLRFKNGNTLDVRLSNLILIPRSKQIRMNSNPAKTGALMRRRAELNLDLESDKKIAFFIAPLNDELRKQVINNKEILELKRTEIKLRRKINERSK